MNNTLLNAKVNDVVVIFIRARFGTHKSGTGTITKINDSTVIVNSSNEIFTFNKTTGEDNSPLTFKWEAALANSQRAKKLQEIEDNS